jgi:hypothetical protein
MRYYILIWWFLQAILLWMTVRYAHLAPENKLKAVKLLDKPVPRETDD